MLSDKSDLTVIEADEFDRSFHWLKPYMAVITAADPDHLDIYGTPEAYREKFRTFYLVDPPGRLPAYETKASTSLPAREVLYLYRRSRRKEYTFHSVTEIADFYAENIRICDGNITFDFVGPEIRIPDVELGVPVKG